MKIKSIHTKRINYGFGVALLVLAMLFVFALQEGVSSNFTDNTREDPKPELKNKIQNFQAQLLELQINQENLKKIKQKRTEALPKGLLFTSRADLVPADIRINDEVFSANIRLKGDLLDHLRGDKWSYRIELKNKKSWRNMTTFSIHNSKARSHIAEWYMHQLFNHEGIITPLYDFIQVEKNGELKGVYAFEEHFTDALLLRNKKQIGPILKHNDDAYWENVQKNIKPFYWTKALDIDLFNKNNSNDAEFMKSFEYGKSLLHRFLNSEISAVEIFNLDKMAKYYALMELSHAYHAQQITNIRFYLDPQTGKLEPIAFDCFGEDLPGVTESWEAAGEGINPEVSPREGYPYGGVYMHLLFQDVEFFKKYMYYLNHYTEPGFLNRMHNLFSAGAEDRESFIKKDKEYSEYTFSHAQFFKKAVFTRKKIFSLPQYSLKVFTNNNIRKDLTLKSFHYFPMEVIGLGNEDEMTESLKKPLYLEGYNKNTKQKIYSLSNPRERKFVYYKTLGIDSIFMLDIKQNNSPYVNAEPIKPDLSFWLEDDILELNDDTLSFVNERTTLSQHLIIPKDYILVITAGQEIFLENETAIISDSPVIANGTINNRIKIVGKGNAKQGLVFNADQNFIHTDFVNLSGISHKGMNTKSGLSVTGQTNLMNCSFDLSRSQYALIVNNSVFDFQNISVANTQGHGIQVFGSQGVIQDVKLVDIAGDGLVIADSDIDIGNGVFQQVNGTAVLVSNSNTTTLHSIQIKDSFQGLVLNDNLSINCDHIDLINLQNGIVMTSLKSKNSHLIGKSIVFQDVKNKVSPDLYSTMLINGKKVKH